MLIELKISNENHEFQEENNKDIMHDYISPEQKKESKESLMMKIKDV